MKEGREQGQAASQEISPILDPINRCGYSSCQNLRKLHLELKVGT